MKKTSCRKTEKENQFLFDTYISYTFPSLRKKAFFVSCDKNSGLQNPSTKYTCYFFSCIVICLENLQEYNELEYYIFLQIIFGICLHAKVSLVTQEHVPRAPSSFYSLLQF